MTIFFEKAQTTDSPDIIENPHFSQALNAFDNYLINTHKRYWNPKDSAYLDFTDGFDCHKQALLDESNFPELQGPLGNILNTEQKLLYINTYAAKMVTGMLYAEQAATFACVNLSKMLANFSAVEYALNQAREEARHISGFNQYITHRFQAPVPIRSVYKNLLSKIINAPRIHLQIVGVQVILEGLGMSSLSYFTRKSKDPALQRLCRLVMSDEASHHKFGIDWLQQLDTLNKSDRNEAEDWAWYCFDQFWQSTFAPEKIIQFYKELGFDQVNAIKITHKYHLGEQTDSGKMFFQLAKTLQKNGLITNRTLHHYAPWLDSTFKDEEDIYQQIITDTITLLEDINTNRPSKHLRGI
ncbi:ferritin-like domain-containing protein [Entomomonas moraniae]|uniref:Ferritin-like domain-containing protein n=1 Tax=Entomomonas moraniae TaxID=2213226 RepID=A0A3S9XBA3_9GAMM|nr:ferritin-like domain-containing protein [Entomomonas moraniae]AZS49719.1 ferritin-like domain-containing protein [Entomomonas moraniae]